MKAIIFRDKETNKIISDSNDYERLKKQGKTDEEIIKMVEEYNSTEKSKIAQVVELDEYAQFYKTQKANAYKEQQEDFELIGDALRDLAEKIDNYIENAKKIYSKEKKQ